MKHLTVILVAALMSICGCYVPVGAKPKPTATARPRPVATNASLSGGNSATASTSDRLTVNGETITAADIWRSARPSLLREGETLGPVEHRQWVERTGAILIRDKVAEMLLHQEASLRQPEELNKRIDEIVESEIRKIVARDYEGIQRRYERELDSQGLTIDEVRTRLRREVVIARHLETEIKPRIVEPTRAELLAAFEANKDFWRRSPSRSMALIDIRIENQLPADVDEPTSDQLEAAKAKALSIAQTAQTELESGTDFADLARKYSNGLHAAEGGAWGRVTKEAVRERFVPAVEALEELREGEVSGIIEGEDCFFLVKCIEFDPGMEPDFASVQPELKERHFVAAYNRMVAESVAELQAKARIEPANLDDFYTAVVAAGPQYNGSAAP